MQIFKSLIGNENIKNTLGSAIVNSEFLHAYIIEGPRGSGRHTVARLASAAIMCKDKDNLPCGKCNTCHKILSDNCADVRFFDAFKVDDIRKIKETLYESTTECEYKIYVFNDCEKMNIASQNALLLVLEEPPKNVIFFLICNDSSALLETIRSRAQILRTMPLENDVIFDYVKNNSRVQIDEEGLKEIIVSSRGSLGYTLDMLDENKADSLFKEREKARVFTESILNNDTECARLISSMFQTSRDKLRELFSTSLNVLRDLAIVKKSRSASLCFYTSQNDAIASSSRHSLKKIITAIEAIENALYDLNVNASVPCALTNIMTQIKKGS